jgi:hypothetical protein
LGGGFDVDFTEDLTGVCELGGSSGFRMGLLAGEGETNGMDGLRFVDALILGCRCGCETTFAVGLETGVWIEIAVNLLTAAGGETVSTGLEDDDLGCEVGSAERVQDEDGMIEGVLLRLSFGTGDLGGHSRFSLTSSVAESSVACEATLELRGEAPTDDWRLFCCSKRPIRLATLWRGRSSGSGMLL